MKISLLVPCYNEEKSLSNTIKSCLEQTRPFDEMIFVNDASKDKTLEILNKYSNKIIVRSTPKNTGNKSSAQEFGLKFVTGDIVVTTDADTLLDRHFVEEIEKDFLDPKIVAVAGHVKSLPYNWLTLCRAFDYSIGQNIHKLAQDYMDFIFVMPGAASAFRTDIFQKYITFDHDTLTEDLDFTYKLHRRYFKITYNKKAISYTQDPATVRDYVNQMRRWFGGGWQNLLKHYSIITTKPIRAFELSIIYTEGLIFSVLFFVLPIINPWYGFWLFVNYLAVAFILAFWTAWQEKRWSLILVPIPYIFVMFLNSYVYLEQFYKEIILKKKNLNWFKPERLNINNLNN